MCNFVTFGTETMGFGASLFGEVLATCKKKVSQYTVSSQHQKRQRHPIGQTMVKATTLPRKITA